MMRISLKQGLWEKGSHLVLDLPEKWNVEVLNMEGDRKRVLGAGAYRRALASLVPLLKGKKEICILFDDISRPTRTYQIAPFLLELFDRCGIRDEQVRFLCALGTHSPLDNRVFRKKLGEEVLERFPVYNHNPFENCEHIGKTKLDTPVIVNKEYLSCDVRIGIGSFLLHSFCGFGGGYKIVMPGVSHIDAMMYHHGELLKQCWDACYGIGRHAGNPLLEDLREYGKIARLDGVVNVLVNSRAQSVDIYAGTPDGLYEAFAEKALAHYRTPFTRKADVVFANTYAKANEGVIALSLAEQLLKDEGGYVVVLCDVEAGQVIHYLLGRFGKHSWGRLTFGERIKDSKVKKIFIVSRYRDRASDWWFGKEEDLEFFNNTKDLMARLKDIYRDKAIDVSIIPDGTIQALA